MERKALSFVFAAFFFFLAALIVRLTIFGI